MIHRGEIVEKVVRKSGYTLTKLAQKLGISRNTLYYKFKEPNLNYHFIMRIGNAIHYDFTLEIPDMEQLPDLTEENFIFNLVGEEKAKELCKMREKYVGMLEKYIKLLAIVVKLTNYKELYVIPQELLQLIEQDIQLNSKVSAQGGSSSF